MDLPADWKGVFFRELSVFNLEAVWDELPVSLELTNWYFGTTSEAAAIFEVAPDMTGRTFRAAHHAVRAACRDSHVGR